MAHCESEPSGKHKRIFSFNQLRETIRTIESCRHSGRCEDGNLDSVSFSLSCICITNVTERTLDATYNGISDSPCTPGVLCISPNDSLVLHSAIQLVKTDAVYTQGSLGMCLTTIFSRIPFCSLSEVQYTPWHLRAEADLYVDSRPTWSCENSLSRPAVNTIVTCEYTDDHLICLSP